jgi:hypothetical protein
MGKETIPKETKEKVWKKRNGDFINGKCFCCKCVILYKNFEAGHIIAESKGGTIEVNNLEPVCGYCNKSMGTMNMNEYIEKNFKDRKGEKTFYEKYENKCPLCCCQILCTSNEIYEKIDNGFYICKECYNEYKNFEENNICENLKDYKLFNFSLTRNDIKGYILQIKNDKTINIKKLIDDEINDTSLCHLLFLYSKELYNNKINDDEFNNTTIIFLTYCMDVLNKYNQINVISNILFIINIPVYNRYTCNIKKYEYDIIITSICMFILGDDEIKNKIIEHLTHFDNKEKLFENKQIYDLFINSLIYYYKNENVDIDEMKDILYKFKHNIYKKDCVENYINLMLNIKNNNVYNLNNIINKYIDKYKNNHIFKKNKYEKYCRKNGKKLAEKILNDVEKIIL